MTSFINEAINVKDLIYDGFIRNKGFKNNGISLERLLSLQNL